MSEREPEQISFDDELRKYLLAVPFVPFDIMTTSGERIAITDNLQAAVNSSTVGVFLPKYGFHLIRKNQIVSVQVHEKASA
jgi:hypothetical protein